MNACRSAGQAPLYTGLHGWARVFLRAGAGAFVGTQWVVGDGAAKVFAEEFYRSLLDGSDLGESLRCARAATQEAPGDPTWLAYTLYGDPAAHLQPAG
jgi:CHAT domain-containing protein